MKRCVGQPRWSSTSLGRSRLSSRVMLGSVPLGAGAGATAGEGAGPGEGAGEGAGVALLPPPGDTSTVALYSTAVSWNCHGPNMLGAVA